MWQINSVDWLSSNISSLVVFPSECHHPKTARGWWTWPGSRALFQYDGWGGHGAVCQGGGEEHAKHAQVPRKVSYKNLTQQYWENLIVHKAQYSYMILFLIHSREKPPSMMDEDSHCSSVCTGNVLGSSLPSVAAPGLTSPLYMATPVDHDYAKRKTLRRQQWQQQHKEQQADGTVPVLDTASGVGRYALSALGQAHWGVLRRLITMLMALVSVIMIPTCTGWLGCGEMGNMATDWLLCCTL